MTKLRHKQNGLIYILISQKQGYYLACNDGRVPSGQMMYWSDELIREVFDVLT
jgi:hypothetical protein